MGAVAWLAPSQRGWPDRSGPALSSARRKTRIHCAGPAEPGFEEYVSDPAKPVPFLRRPIHLEGEQAESMIGKLGW